jgi:hypothetical protein
MGAYEYRGADPPSVVAAIADLDLAEDTSGVAGYADLNDVFLDSDDGAALHFEVVSNSNVDLVTATINADSALDLTVAADSSGAAVVVVSATDSDLMACRDTFTVNVLPRNDAPFVEAPLADDTAQAGAPYSLDLSTTFGDIDEGDHLALSAEESGTGALPGWLSLTGTDLSGTPTNADSGIVAIVVTATDDSTAAVSDTFELYVEPTVSVTSRRSEPGRSNAPDFVVTPNPLLAGSDMAELWYRTRERCEARVTVYGAGGSIWFRNSYNVVPSAGRHVSLGTWDPTVVPPGVYLAVLSVRKAGGESARHEFKVGVRTR